LKRIINYLKEYNQYQKENADRHCSTIVEHYRLNVCATTMSTNPRTKNTTLWSKNSAYTTTKDSCMTEILQYRKQGRDQMMSPWLSSFVAYGQHLNERHKLFQFGWFLLRNLDASSETENLQ